MSASHAIARSPAIALAALLAMLPMGASAQPDDGRELAAQWFEEGAAAGSGDGHKIGYISLGEAEEFVALVTEGIREQADIAGVELVFCDAQFDPDEALICARQLAGVGAEGILNYQATESEAGRICEAHGGLPTIAIDIHQPPCERSFVGVDNRFAGLVAGRALGEHLQAERDCRYDTFFVLGAGLVGTVGQERTGGMVDGFAEICGPVPEAKLVERDVGGDFETTLEVFTAELTKQPAEGVHVVVSVNHNAAFGAAAAAEAISRASELRIASQGAETIKPEIFCEDHWVVATAYFPERYGRILIPAMVALLDDEELPADLYVPNVAVTAENMAEVYGELPLCDVE